MSNNSAHVTALIKELLILNRTESSPSIELLTDNEIEGRRVNRRKIRHELVQALHLQRRKQSLTS